MHCEGGGSVAMLTLEIKDYDLHYKSSLILAPNLHSQIISFKTLTYIHTHATTNKINLAIF